MKQENNIPNLKEPLSLKEMEEFLEVFKKKFSSFQKRAPIFFTFQVSPLTIFLQIEGDLTIIEFKIDYSNTVEGEIARIKNFLRDNKYPILTKKEVQKVTPDIHEINDLTKSKNISFNDAFNQLSRKEVVQNFILDKIDIFKNRAILIEQDNYGKKYFFQVNMPILILLKDLKTLSKEDKYKVFIRNSERSDT